MDIPNVSIDIDENRDDDVEANCRNSKNMKEQGDLQFDNCANSGQEIKIISDLNKSGGNDAFEDIKTKSYVSSEICGGSKSSQENLNPSELGLDVENPSLEDRKGNVTQNSSQRTGQ